MPERSNPGIADVGSDSTGIRAWVLVKNALANLVRALSSSAVSVLLPLCLVIVFRPEVFAAWALVFSLGAFVTYFDLGVPTTVQAMVGRATSVADIRTARRVTLSGLKLVGAVSAVCLAAAVASASVFSQIFPDMPVGLQADAKTALVLIVLGQISGLLGNTVSAYFAGQQRSIIPALILAPARLLSMVMALAAATVSADLVLTAVWYAAPLLLGTLLLSGRFFVESAMARRANTSAPSYNEQVGVMALLKYSGPLMLWGICALITTGAGVILVARFDYSAVVPFSIAAIVVAALAGLESAATAPLLPELAGTHELHGDERVSLHTHTMSTLNGAFLFFVTASLLALAPWFLPFLAKDANHGLLFSWSILAVLLIGNAIHLTGTPVSLAFIATKSHSRVIAPPVIEAAVNLAVSVWLGITYGAIGVAIGALIGGIVGICLCFSWSIRLSGVLSTPRWSMLLRSTVRPLASISPVVVTVLLVILSEGEDTWWGLAACALGLTATCAGLWRGSLSSGLRQRVLRKLGTRGRSA